MGLAVPLSNLWLRHWLHKTLKLYRKSGIAGVGHGDEQCFVLYRKSGGNRH